MKVHFLVFFFNFYSIHIMWTELCPLVVLFGRAMAWNKKVGYSLRCASLRRDKKGGRCITSFKVCFVVIYPLKSWFYNPRLQIPKWQRKNPWVSLWTSVSDITAKTVLTNRTIFRLKRDIGLCCTFCFVWFLSALQFILLSFLFPNLNNKTKY